MEGQSGLLELSIISWVYAVEGYLLRLQDTVCSLMFMKKILPSFSSCRIQACMHSTLPLKKAALASNSCTDWVGGTGNLIPVPAVSSSHTKYRLRRI